MEKKLSHVHLSHQYELFGKTLSPEDLRIFNQEGSLATQLLAWKKVKQVQTDAEFARTLEEKDNLHNQKQFIEDAELAMQLHEEELKLRFNPEPKDIPIEEQKIGKVYFENVMNWYFFCPYGCGQLIEVSKAPEADSGIYCGIFHCGRYINDTGKTVPIPQHAKDDQIEEWREARRLVTPCGFQFCIRVEGRTLVIEQCSNL